MITLNSCIPTEIREAIIKAYKGRCQYCNHIFGNEFLEVDHIDPVARGGKDELENYTLACRRCNEKKTGHLLEEPGRSLLKTIAKRKKLIILKIINENQKNGVQKKKNVVKQLVANEEMWDKREFDGFGVAYPLPINQLAIKLYSSFFHNPKLFIKKYGSHCLCLNPKEINTLLEYYKADLDDLEMSLQWLLRLTKRGGNSVASSVVSDYIIYSGDGYCYGIQISLYEPSQKIEMALASLISEG